MYLDARCDRFVCFAKFSVTAVQCFNLDLVFTDVSLELLPLARKLYLVLALNFSDCSLQLVDGALASFPLKYHVRLHLYSVIGIAGFHKLK